MIGIYKITSPTNRIYIGQSVDIELRFKYYKYLKCKSQKKVYNSILKYGYDNHIFEVIEECKIELLNERERYWQDFYNCIEYGLNCCYTKSNNKSGKHSKETIENIKKSLIGIIKKKPKPMSNEQKEKLSKTQKERFKNKENHPRFNVKMSDDTKLKISKTKKERGQNYLFGFKHQNSKVVLDTQSGVFYDCVKELSLLYDINYTTLKSKLNPNNKIKNNTNFVYA
jgi:group I intron endonuclease